MRALGTNIASARKKQRGRSHLLTRKKKKIKAKPTNIAVQASFVSINYYICNILCRIVSILQTQEKDAGKLTAKT